MVGAAGRFWPAAGGAAARRMTWLPLLLSVGGVGGARQPLGRYGHCAVVHDGRMIIYGGRSYDMAEQGLMPVGDAWAFDLTSLEWSEVAVAENGASAGDRHSHSCVMAARTVNGLGQMIVFGGIARGQIPHMKLVVADLWSLTINPYDLGLSTWTRLRTPPDQPSPRPRYDHAALTLPSGGMLLHGGCLSQVTSAP